MRNNAVDTVNVGQLLVQSWSELRLIDKSAFALLCGGRGHIISIAREVGKLNLLLVLQLLFGAISIQQQQ